MFGIITRKRHEAEMAAVRAEQRTTGKALSEAISERDSLFAMLQTATVRGDRGRMVRWVNTGLGRFWTRTIGQEPIDLSVIGRDIPKPLPTPPETTA